eukprot:UN07613
MALTIWHLYVISWVFVHIAPLVYWAYVHVLCWQHVNVSTYALYSQTIKKLIILQSIQWMELLHTLIKFVLQSAKKIHSLCGALCQLEPTNLIMQVFQLSARFNTVMLCLAYASPWFNTSEDKISEELYSNKYLQFGYITLLLVWSSLHIIRYPFYFCKLWEVQSSLLYILGWFRYSAFFYFISQ